MQDFELELFQLMPWLKDFIKVSVAPHGLALSLCRTECFLFGLRDVELLETEYGFNPMFSKEVNLLFSFVVLSKNNLVTKNYFTFYKVVLFDFEGIIVNVIP